MSCRVLSQSIILVGLIVQRIASSEVEVEYQIGFCRNNTDQYNCMYLFHCEADGRFLRWQLSDIILGGFRGTNIGRAIVDGRPDFDYTAVLLSSEKVDNLRYLQDSVMMVSADQLLNGSEVHCTTNSNSSTAQVGEVSHVANSISSDNKEVVLDFIISTQIVRNSNYTHIFMCGVMTGMMYINLLDHNITFTNRNRIGRREVFLSEDNQTATILIVLIDSQNFMLRAIVFVSGNSNYVSMTCSDGNNPLYITSLVPATMTTTKQSPESSPPVTSSSAHTSTMTKDTMNVSSPNTDLDATDNMDLTSFTSGNHNKSAPMAPSIFWLGQLILVLLVSSLWK